MGEGPCKAHGEGAANDIAVVKRCFLEEFSTGIAIRDAAELAGSSPPTIWRMRQSDHEFDAAVAVVQESADRMRVALVEDSLFTRLSEGKASAAETIFFLVNRAPHRWRSVQHVHSPQLNVDFSALNELELRRIAGGEDPIAVLAETRNAIPLMTRPTLVRSRLD